LRAQAAGSAPAASAAPAFLTNALRVRANFEGGVYTREVALDPGKPFPSIALRDEEGQPARVPVGETLFAFFKTTCPTCELAWPYLDRIGKIAEGGSLSLLAVSQDDPQATRRFYEDLGVAIPTLYDGEPWAASEAVGLTAVPAFFVVGRDGNLRDAVIGFQRHKMEEFAALAADRAGGRRAALYRRGERVPEFKPG
jgi:peroxiredoxin